MVTICVLSVRNMSMLHLICGQLKQCQQTQKSRQLHSIKSFVYSFKKRHFHIVSPGLVSPVRSVPDSIAKPAYAAQGEGSQAAAFKIPAQPEVKTANQVKRMKEACTVAKKLLQFAGSQIQVGVTTDAVDRAIHEECLSMGAYPSPLLYRGFPKSVCTSVNNVICHGIPDDRQLCDGDIVNVDITVFYHGFHGDTSATFLVGDVDREGRDLVEVARHCLQQGILACGPGANYSDIGRDISMYALEQGYNIIPDFCGHGIGEYFHGPPDIYHIDYPNPHGRMEPGVTFTIEPIVCDGEPDMKILSDGWTAVTVDNSRSAQFEHTVLITSSGVEILTL